VSDAKSDGPRDSLGSTYVGIDFCVRPPMTRMQGNNRRDQISAKLGGGGQGDYDIQERDR
jgi:hypothetical protein